MGSVPLAEDLTAETFFRALRSMSSFRWQGKDFGAWLMTIARNLAMDHFKAGRTRLEQTTEDMGTLDTTTEGPENAVLSLLTNEALLEALSQLPTEQRECLVMRFLQGLSIAETADVLGRSAGAVKQPSCAAYATWPRSCPRGRDDPGVGDRQARRSLTRHMDNCAGAITSARTASLSVSSAWTPEDRPCADRRPVGRHDTTLYSTGLHS